MFGQVFSGADEGVVLSEQVLSTLYKPHPRLFLKDSDLEQLKKRSATDNDLARYVNEVIQQAEKMLKKPPLKHVLQGPRLLYVSRECVDRVYTLALAYRWTGDRKYAEKAKENILTVCAFPDWNPSHFLDVAEMVNAVGVGYDWLYDFLPDADRKLIRDGLIKHGLNEGIKCYDKGGWWVKSEFNWNQVCNGGLTVGALAIAETDPAYAERIVPEAVKSFPRALASYDPDGAWMEGPGYWSYASRYTAYGIDAMNTALGTNFGLTKREGLRNSGRFPIYCTGPTGLYLNFADSGSNAKRGPMPCMLWLADEYKDDFLSNMEHMILKDRKADVMHVMWYRPFSAGSDMKMALDKHFDGKVPVVVMRSSWDDKDALWAGVKGGYNQVNHGHLDLGNFEFDAMGVRWARDLGSDDYNLPGYWSGGKGGQRWKYYRLNSFSHNVPIIDGKNQDEFAVAKILEFKESSSPYVVIELTSAYKEFATKVLRRVEMVESRKSLIVTDDFDMNGSHEVVWGMTTDALIKTNGRKAVLELHGKQLNAEVLSPDGAVFSFESAERTKPDAENKGVSRLVVKVHGVTGHIKISIRLTPQQ